jgi:hypothetical protein
MISFPNRSDFNWFDRRRSRRRSTIAQRNSVATAWDERRRSITPGFMMTFASLAAQANPRCSCQLKTEDYDFAPKAGSLDGYRPRNHLGPAVDLPHALPEARGLGVTCGTGNARIVDDFGVCASSGGSRLQAIARLANLHFMPLRWFVKAMAIAVTSHILKEIVTCLNDRPFTMAARLNRSRPIKGRLRFGTSESAPRECRQKTGA